MPSTQIASPTFDQWLLIIISAALLVVLFFIAPIAQDPAYHQFADTRTILGVPNFWNVISNAPFLMAGVYGLYRGRYLAQQSTRLGYKILCISVLMVAAGSSYYHWAPSTAALFWDRLPMTIVFMAAFSLLLDERVLKAPSAYGLALLLALGISSIVYWRWTETQGAGDLRPYVLVQFLPLVLVPVIAIRFKPVYLNTGLLLSALAMYGAAKLFEYFDQALFDLIAVLSGHTIKHLLSGLALYLLIRAVPIHGAVR